LKRVDFAHIKG